LSKSPVSVQWQNRAIVPRILSTSDCAPGPVIVAPSFS
jgi:hypothetical protein